MKEANFKVKIEKDMAVVSFTVDDSEKFSMTFPHLKDFLSSDDLVMQMIPHFIQGAIMQQKIEHEIIHGTGENMPKGFLNFGKNSPNQTTRKSLKVNDETN